MIAAIRILLCAFPAMVLCASGGWAQECQLNPIGSLDVTWAGRRALVDAGINGRPTKGLVDTGSNVTGLVLEGAKALRLRLTPRPYRSQGVDGSIQAYSTYVDELALGRWRMDGGNLFVMGFAVGDDRVGVLLGQDVLSRREIEFDFANNVIKFYKPTGNCAQTPFAYWATEFVDVGIHRPTRNDRYLKADVMLNGKTVTALLDTGAPYTIVTRMAAFRAGVDVGAPNTAPYRPSAGIANRPFETWVATFDSFALGGETVRNARIRIGDMSLGRIDAEMLLGMDFFRAHRILVSYAQGRMYFTHNGGRIFDITSPAQPLRLPSPEAGSGPVDPDQRRE